MASSQNDLIQPFRFRVNRSAFKEQAIEVIQFPWMGKIDAFYKRVEAEFKRKLRPNELVPWRTLNSALNLSAYLIQPFEVSGSIRQAIAPEGVTLPQSNQIGEIAQHFLNYYTMTVFPEARDKNPKPFIELLSGLNFNAVWKDREALSLIVPGNVDNIAFNAIPSIVASSMIDRPITYQGHKITWRAAQQNRKLCLISQPIHSHLKIEDENIVGYFVIRVEFSLRTMPGETEPIIDMSLHCRRYLESANSWTRRKSGTALIETVDPLIQNWPQRSPVQVPLYFAKMGEPESAYYKYGIENFLADLRAAPLQPLKHILLDPMKYWNLDVARQDSYYLVYHEGMYPNHPVETGWPLGDQQQMYQQLSANLEGILQPVDPIRKSRRTFRKIKPTAALHIGELKRRATIDEIREDGQIEAVEVESLGGLIAQAIKQVWLKKQSRPLILLLWFTETTRKSVVEYFDELMQGQLTLQPERIPDGLYKELVDDSEYDTKKVTIRRPDGVNDPRHYRTKMEEYKEIIREKRKQRIIQWIAYLRGLRKKYNMLGSPGNPPEILVLIEQSRFPDHKVDEMRSPKPAIREACIECNYLSQFIHTVEHPEEKPPRENGRLVKSDYHRILGAIYDLLLRQTGITIGSWEAFFQRLDLPEHLEGMELVGLYRAKSYQNNLDIPIAVRFTPSNRHAEMTFPGLKTGRASPVQTAIEWLPYPQACIELGKRIIHERGKILSKKSPTSKEMNEVCLSDAQILDFIDKVIRGPGKEKIVFIDALQFRKKLWTQMKNGEIRMNQYRIPGNGQLSPREVPGVRLVRILAGESPQYTSVGDLKEPNNALLIAGDNSGLPVFYSIGMLAVVRRQKLRETWKEAEKRHPDSEERAFVSKIDYADTAFKHAQMVEVIPFFLQPDDNPEDFAWVAHRLRTTLNWTAGDITHPRPIHLAEAFFEDMACLYDSDGGQGE